MTSRDTLSRALLVMRRFYFGSCAVGARPLAVAANTPPVQTTAKISARIKLGTSGAEYRGSHNLADGLPLQFGVSAIARMLHTLFGEKFCESHSLSPCSTIEGNCIIGTACFFGLQISRREAR